MSPSRQRAREGAVDLPLGVPGLGTVGLSLICVHGENGFNVFKCVLRTSSSNVSLN